MVWTFSPHSQDWSVLSPHLAMLSPVLATPALALLRAHQSCLGSSAPSAISSMGSCTALLGGSLSSKTLHWSILSFWADTWAGNSSTVAKLFLDLSLLGTGTWGCSGCLESKICLLFSILDVVYLLISGGAIPASL